MSPIDTFITERLITFVPDIVALIILVWIFLRYIRLRNEAADKRETHLALIVSQNSTVIEKNNEVLGRVLELLRTASPWCRFPGGPPRDEADTNPVRDA